MIGVEREELCGEMGVEKKTSSEELGMSLACL